MNTLFPGHSLRLVAPLLLLVVGATGCGGDEEQKTTETPPPPLSCADDELLLPDGRCIHPGVPADGCSTGFEHDGVDRCEPLLPAEDCPPGLMAAPGDETCHEVMACGDGTWGDIVTDETSEHVDGSYGGGDSDGSASRPWTTIQDAIDEAAPSATIAIAAGHYGESLEIANKPLQLWGRCPSMVEVTGATGTEEAIGIRDTTGSVTVRGIAVTNAMLGVFASNAAPVAFDQVWIHDVGRWGMQLLDADVTVTASLIEEAHQVGLSIDGGRLTIDATEVRDTQPGTDGAMGFGVVGGRGELAITRTLLLRNHCIHILAQGTQLAMDGVVMGDARVGNYGTQPKADGLLVMSGDEGPGSAEIHGSLVEGGEGGIVVAASTATIQNTVVRDLSTGPGVSLHNHQGERASVTIQGSVVERSPDIAIAAYSSDLILTSSRVTDTAPAPTWPYGYGVEVANVGVGPANLTIHESLIERSVGPNVAVFGSNATIDGTVIRDALPSAGGPHSYGLALQRNDGVPSMGQVTASRIERSVSFGVAVLDAQATLHGIQVLDTLPDAEGLFGDGISVESIASESGATITASLVTRSARAGLSNWGSTVALGDTAFVCQQFDLNGEDGFQFEDLGGNACGCPEPEAQCKQVSASLTPPPPLGAGP